MGPNLRPELTAMWTELYQIWGRDRAIIHVQNGGRLQKTVLLAGTRQPIDRLYLVKRHRLLKLAIVKRFK